MMIKFINLKNKNSVRLVKDVLVYPLRVNKDGSGILVETLRTDWKGIYGEGREFAMQYYSVTPPGLARDENVWHCHPTQEDRFLVIAGEIVVAVADPRGGSSTNSLLNLFYMKASTDPYILLIPKQTLHGFMVVSSTSATLLNFPTALYNPKEEERISYKDAGVKLPNGALFNWDLVRSYLQKING